MSPWRALAPRAAARAPAARRRWADAARRARRDVLRARSGWSHFPAASCARRTPPPRARSPPRVQQVDHGLRRGVGAAGGARQAGRSVWPSACEPRRRPIAFCAELVVLELGGAGREGAESHRVVVRGAAHRARWHAVERRRGARRGARPWSQLFTAFLWPRREKRFDLVKARSRRFRIASLAFAPPSRPRRSWFRRAELRPDRRSSPTPARPEEVAAVRRNLAVGILGTSFPRHLPVAARRRPRRPTSRCRGHAGQAAQITAGAKNCRSAAANSQDEADPDRRPRRRRVTPLPGGHRRAGAAGPPRQAGRGKRAQSCSARSRSSAARRALKCSSRPSRTADAAATSRRRRRRAVGRIAAGERVRLPSPTPHWLFEKCCPS